MDGGVLEAVVAPLSAALDQLLAVDITSIGSVELVGLLEQLETARHRFTAVDHRVLAEVDQRGVAGDFARTSTAALLVSRLRVAPGEAKARVAQARVTQPVRLPSGEPVPAVLPRCAAAVVAGVVSAGHVSVIAKTLDALTPAVAFEAGPVAEAMPIEAAQHQHPGQVARTGALLLARLDPDGVLSREDELAGRRGFTMQRRGDGSARVSGDWTPEVTAMWQAVLDSLSAPLAAADGTPDDRSPAQRRHDAMAEAAARLLRSATLPSANGSR